MRTARSPAAISMPSRSPSPPTRSRSRCARSARSPSGASSVLVDPKMSGLPAFLTRGLGRQLGPDDPAGHRRCAGQREQEPRFSGERRFDPDLGRSGGPCLDGADRRAQGGADRAQRGGRDRGRADGGGRGHRLSRAAKTSPRLQAVHAAVRARSPHFTADRYWADEMAALQAAVLGGEIGGGCFRCLADPVPVSRLADDGEDAAANLHPVGPTCSMVPLAFMSRLAT